MASSTTSSGGWPRPEPAARPDAPDPVAPEPAGQLICVDGPRAAADEAARCVAEAIGAVLARDEWCSLALPAGHFNAALYERLAAYSLDWSRVEFFFSEERCVPPGHPASSYGEADDRLFTNPRIGHHQVHRIEADRPDRQAAAERYAEELPERFDVVLVEVGTDGALGALLPGSPAFDAPGDVHVIEGPLTPRYRMTLAPRCFSSAAAQVVVACGAERAPAVRAALLEEGPARELPARLVRDGTWIVDRAAARELGRADG